VAAEPATSVRSGSPTTTAAPAFPSNENDHTHLHSLDVRMSSGDVEDPDEEYCDHEHFSNRAPWLRAMVLGANDGLVSVAALMMGVAGGNADLSFLRLSGVAGLIAGALSMAVGEYVSVSSQRDAEHADIKKEIEEQLKGPEAQARELEELAQIYVSRGVPYHLAFQVAHHLTETDVIRAHARDELGIDIDDMANPWQAAGVSFLCFGLGATIPLLAGAFLAEQWARILSILLSTTAGLLIFGVLGAYLGGASVTKGALRVVLGGWAALGISYGIGAAFDVGAA
jgi:VIT1/CCC1 family predicted Fe2+/Mn2+ transporter